MGEQKTAGFWSACETEMRKFNNLGVKNIFLAGGNGVFDYLRSIGIQGWPSALPVYSARGRMSRLFRYCSRIWAVHPDMRLTAKIGVYRSTGIPRE
jgi:hypothetical protein